MLIQRMRVSAQLMGRKADAEKCAVGDGFALVRRSKRRRRAQTPGAIYAPAAGQQDAANSAAFREEGCSPRHAYTRPTVPMARTLNDCHMPQPLIPILSGSDQRTPTWVGEGARSQKAIVK